MTPCLPCQWTDGSTLRAGFLDVFGAPTHVGRAPQPIYLDHFHVILIYLALYWVLLIQTITPI